MRKRSSLALSLSLSLPVSSALLSPEASAQITKAQVLVGAKGDHGCQNRQNPPTLSGGVAASAKLDFAYNAGNGELRLRVTNTSPVKRGIPNPLITELFFNLPHGAVSKVALVSQSGDGGARPRFALAGPRKVGCLGTFDVHLDGFQGRGGGGAIANATANTLSGPKNSQVIGPVEFRLKLTGPGIDTLTAGAIAHGFSTTAPFRKASAAIKFQSAGRSGEESGFLGSATGCAGGVWLLGEPRIGSQVELCASGGNGCHGCIILSLKPGPVRLGNLIVPIGLPLLEIVNLPPFPANNTHCIGARIPNDKQLVGVRFYIAEVTVSSRQEIDFSQAIVIEILDR